LRDGVRVRRRIAEHAAARQAAARGAARRRRAAGEGAGGLTPGGLMTLNPTLHGLLAACKEDPADDLPRLVLADWPEAQGQPERGAFVRAQVEAAQDDLGVSWYRDRDDSMQRLLRWHGDVWLGALKDLAPVWYWDRGLLRLGVPASKLATWP